MQVIAAIKNAGGNRNLIFLEQHARKNIVIRTRDIKNPINKTP
jgi:hypothetical protein